MPQIGEKVARMPTDAHTAHTLGLMLAAAAAVLLNHADPSRRCALSVARCLLRVVGCALHVARLLRRTHACRRCLR